MDSETMSDKTPGTHPLDYRALTVHIGSWADAESFDIDHREIRRRLCDAFPGAQVGVKGDSIMSYQVSNSDPAWQPEREVHSVAALAESNNTLRSDLDSLHLPTPPEVL